eukprot:746522-Hanusia_phi.AAC.15
MSSAEQLEQGMTLTISRSLGTIQVKGKPASVFSPGSSHRKTGFRAARPGSPARHHLPTSPSLEVPSCRLQIVTSRSSCADCQLNNSVRSVFSHSGLCGWLGVDGWPSQALSWPAVAFAPTEGGT